MVGSLCHTDARDDCSFTEYPYQNNLASARIASNSAVSSFYKSTLWRNFCKEDQTGELDVATRLFKARQLVDMAAGDENESLALHDVIEHYNSFLSVIIDEFVVNQVAKRKKAIRQKLNSPQKETRRSAKVMISLLDLILSFSTLKESVGMERATLSGLIANGIGDRNNGNDKSEIGVVSATLNLIINDLVMAVESQRRIMRELKTQYGLNMRRSLSLSSNDVISTTGAQEKTELLFDEHYCTLLRLVGKSVMPSETMRSVQEHIRKDFDIGGFQQVCSKLKMLCTFTYLDLYFHLCSTSSHELLHFSNHILGNHNEGFLGWHYPLHGPDAFHGAGSARRAGKLRGKF